MRSHLRLSDVIAGFSRDPPPQPHPAPVSPAQGQVELTVYPLLTDLELTSLSSSQRPVSKLHGEFLSYTSLPHSLYGYAIAMESNYQCVFFHHARGIEVIILSK